MTLINKEARIKSQQRPMLHDPQSQQSTLFIQFGINSPRVLIVPKAAFLHESWDHRPAGTQPAARGQARSAIVENWWQNPPWKEAFCP
ncbi:hypothetical protein AV530_003584 [Patagioenas fasciata monilis]|uniref:Uncharacterized protein n=1 Tax=Patagioenas fasciata monilis TaxID=372326 RepID=A0A1V4KY08_PATFA|nr:hypothetical protein AV530_003584 [Patagioenas fasciata monilis]